jgi:hypothetical protein
MFASANIPFVFWCVTCARLWCRTATPALPPLPLIVTSNSLVEPRLETREFPGENEPISRVIRNGAGTGIAASF